MIRKSIFLLLFFTFSGILFLQSFAQKENRDNLLTIDRLFNSDEFKLESLKPIQWFKNGNSYTILEESASLSGGKNIVEYDIQASASKVLIPAEQLIPEGLEMPLEIASYQWSNDDSKVLIFTNSKRVWRTNTRGDYWIYDRNNSELKQLGEGLPELSLMFAKFSPDQKSVAFVSGFNIYVENLSSGEITQLTTDGTRDIINGTFDWAYEEEFSCKDGFRWSSDGKSIAYWQLDASEIKNFLMINYTDSVYSHIIPLQYPKVGENPSSAKIGIVNIESKETVWMSIPGDEKQHYIPRMQWVGDVVLVQQLNRKQNTLKFWKCNSVSGKAELIYTEKTDSWIDIMNPDLSVKRRGMDDLEIVDDGNAVLHLTEKNGWKQIYKVSLTGKNELQVTNTGYDIASTYTLNKEEGILYASASPNDATQRYLYKIKLTKDEDCECVTPSNLSGVNKYNISPNGKYAIHEFSNSNTPTTYNLISLPDHKILKKFVTNKIYAQQIKNLSLPKYEFFKIKTADGILMDGKILKPLNFDPSKKYPVLFYVYGEPWTQTVVDTWKFGWEHLLAQMGYVIVSVDNRGTPAPKGSSWRKSIYKKIGIINSHDQAMAAKEILKWDFVDKDRVAVWGWSGGGSMTLNLMFRYPEIYKTGMAVAFVANQLYYDNIYQERYMGLPSENLEAFVEGSPITYAKNLEGNLLLVHGTGDDNVHYQNAEALVNELIKHNKQFQIMPYPNRSHGIYEGENTTRHLYTLLTNFLASNCPPGVR